jgi:hypothetical protein
MAMAVKPAPGRQSGRLNAGAAPRYQVAKFGGLPSGLLHARLGGQGVVLPTGMPSRMSAS